MRVYGRSKSLIEKHQNEASQKCDNMSLLLSRTMENRPGNENYLRGIV